MMRNKSSPDHDMSVAAGQKIKNFQVEHNSECLSSNDSPGLKVPQMTPKLMAHSDMRSGLMEMPLNIYSRARLNELDDDRSLDVKAFYNVPKGRSMFKSECNIEVKRRLPGSLSEYMNIPQQGKLGEPRAKDFQNRNTLTTGSLLKPRELEDGDLDIPFFSSGNGKVSMVCNKYFLD